MTATAAVKWIAKGPLLAALVVFGLLAWAATSLLDRLDGFPSDVADFLP